MKGLVILLAMCTLTAAMVTPEKTPVDPLPDCETPCAWTTYASNSNVNLEYGVLTPNTSCKCGKGTVCLVAEDDAPSSILIYRCLPEPHPRND